MSKKTVSPLNLGTAKSPIDFGQRSYAYRRNGRWRCRNVETMRRFGRKFVDANDHDANDHDLIMELESRGYQILIPRTNAWTVLICRVRPARELRCAQPERRKVIAPHRVVCGCD